MVLKLNLQPISRRGGMAISTAASIDTRTGRMESASVIVPLTLPVTQRLSFNLNAGYSYLRTAAHPRSIFWGGQVEAQIGREVTLMAEAFGRAGEPAGAQAGLRWNPRGGAVDVDLLVGRYVDGASPRAITVGLTVRR
jgi:hypothetical protein